MVAKDEVVARVDCSPDGFPPGWTKEIKCRMSNGRVKKDLFYIDPVTGYIFRSRKDAFRFIESGVISKHVSRPKNSCTSNLYSIEGTPLCIAAIEPRSHESSARQCLYFGEGENSMEKCITGANDVSSNSLEVEGNSNFPQLENHLYPASQVHGNECHSLELEKVTTLEPSIEKLKSTISEKPFKQLKQLSKTPEILKLSLPEEKHPELMTEKQFQSANENLERRGKCGRPTNRGRRNHLLHSQKRTIKEAKPKTLKAITMPICDRSLRETVKTVKHITCPKEKMNAEVNSGSHQTSGMSDDKSQSALRLPFGDFWLDPCLEFAIKILTGDIPLLEENAPIKDHFCRHLTSVQSSSQVSSAPLSFMEDGMHSGCR
ncbi:hypothetical protein J5N97_024005 [Dioscorea zingiberensis]|uniref:MBD domain-containing protein n=1 Tax=Dioscorea zingiberensis TaxID=325984 RepID=A0A9D5C668_9LILI|nr:hypothetical protein J5N97_024005 [Dioscorea zingiberensis]